MSEFENTSAPVEAPTNVIPDQNVHATSGGGQQPLKEEVPVEEKPRAKETVRESVRAALKEQTKQQEEKVIPEVDTAEDKAAKAEIPAEKKDSEDKELKSAEPKKADAGEQEKTQTRERKSEVRERPEPPARFLPRAKELWYNTPAEVQSEVSRLSQEHETELSQYKESHAFREELREFEEMGKQHNISIKQALNNYVDIERKLAQNPHEGFKQILTNMNMQPSDAIAAICQAYGVSPQTLAQHITQSPQSYQPRQAQQPQDQYQAQQYEDPRVSQLQEQINQMAQEKAVKEYVEPFAAEHPRFYELQDDIVFFMQSGKIPNSLSPLDKLAAAYDMAERLNPSSHATKELSKEAESEGRVEPDLNGTKSVKSSPGRVLESPEPAKKVSTRDMLYEELRKLKRS